MIILYGYSLWLNLAMCRMWSPVAIEVWENRDAMIIILFLIHNVMIIVMCIYINEIESLPGSWIKTQLF